MEEIFFMFRNKIYKQTEGTCIGSCLSSLIAGIFMKTFENNLQTSPQFPKLWLRYVDDIFVIIKRSELNNTLTWLNSQHPNIVFIMEQE
jgi:hypothetical protein